jgi:hypothetical protein
LTGTESNDVTSSPLNALAATPRSLAHLVVDLTDEALDEAGPGAWSARTILAHFRDVEFMVFRLRLERALAEDDPLVAPFDETPWSEGRNRSRDRKEQLLGDFALQRQASLNILQALSPGDRRRSFRRVDGTQGTVDSLLERWLEHDREHLGQLEAMLGETAEGARLRRARLG